MLTADQVEVRRRGDQLFLKPIPDEDRPRALSLGEAYLGLARAHLGRARGQLLEACREIPVAAKDRKLAAGLLKLVLDRCQFEESTAGDPAQVRAELFTRAAAARRQRNPLGGLVAFDRQAVMAETAQALGLTGEALEQAMYADLPEAHKLAELQLPGTPEQLLAVHQGSGIQAVLLRAVRVRARVTGASAAAYRHLFRKLKFLRLLHSIERGTLRGFRTSRDGAAAGDPPPPHATVALPPSRPSKKGDAGAETDPGYLITIDGPFSLFESVTKYGLQLAMAYPAIAACGRYHLEADIRWGKERRALRFIVKGDAGETAAVRLPPLPAEVEALRAALAKADGAAAAGTTGAWTVRAAADLIDLPGAGVLVPDLELRHQSGRRVLVEVLGFWSRDAVWKRIELAPALPHPVIFAVSKHLRVSEAALPDDLPAALYVYAHTMSARAVLEKADLLLGR